MPGIRWKSSWKLFKSYSPQSRRDRKEFSNLEIFSFAESPKEDFLGWTLNSICYLCVSAVNFDFLRGHQFCLKIILPMWYYGCLLKSRFIHNLKGKLMKAKVYVTLKKGILDPQGKAVQHSLEAMEFDEVMDVRQGKVFELTLSEDLSKEDAEKRVTDMAEKLLANTVMENFRVEIG